MTGGVGTLLLAGWLFERLRPLGIVSWLASSTILGLGAIGVTIWPAESIWLVLWVTFGAFLALVLVGRHGGQARQLAILGTAGLMFLLLVVQAWVIADFRASYPDITMAPGAGEEQISQVDRQLEEQAKGRGDRLAATAAPDRPAAWSAALAMAAEAGWLGPGPGSWARRAPLYTNHGMVRSFSFYLVAAHHDGLQIVAEWGWLPMTVMLVLLFTALWRQAERVGSSSTEAVGYLSLVTMLLASLAHWPLQIPACAAWMAIFAGMGWSRSVGETVKPESA